MAHVTGVTISTLITSEDRVTAYCLNLLGQFRKPPCTHGGPVDLFRVRERLGRDDLRIYDHRVQQILVCSRCGTHGATFICSPPSWAISSGERDAHYAKLAAIARTAR